MSVNEVGSDFFIAGEAPAVLFQFVEEPFDFAPTIEPIIASSIRTGAEQQIPPWSIHTQHSENPVQDPATIYPRDAMGLVTPAQSPAIPPPSDCDALS